MLPRSVLYRVGPSSVLRSPGDYEVGTGRIDLPRFGGNLYDEAAAVRGVKFKRTTRYTDDGDPIVTEHMDLDHHAKSEPLRLLAIHTGLMEKALESNARHFDRFLKALTGEYVPMRQGGTGRIKWR